VFSRAEKLTVPLPEAPPLAESQDGSDTDTVHGHPDGAVTVKEPLYAEFAGTLTEFGPWIWYEHGGGGATVSTTGVRVPALPVVAAVTPTTPKELPTVTMPGSRIRERKVGAVPLVAESEAPGIPTTCALNGMVPLVAVRLNGKELLEDPCT